MEYIDIFDENNNPIGEIKEKTKAHRKAEGIIVKMTCYTAEFIGEIKPSSEIQEIRWLNYKDIDIISPVDKLIFKDLYENGILIKM